MKVFVAGDFCPKGIITNELENRHYEVVLGNIASIVKCDPNLKCTEMCKFFTKCFEPNNKSIYMRITAERATTL